MVTDLKYLQKATIKSDVVSLTIEEAQQADRKIIKVADMPSQSVKNYINANGLNLPKEVAVTLSDNSQKQLGVAWDTSNYDNSIPEDYLLTGNLVMEQGIINPEHLTAKIKITVCDDLGHSFRDDLINSLDNAYTSLKCIPLRTEYKEHLIKEILKAEAVLDTKNPTSRDYITVNRTLSKIAEDMPDKVWYFTSPEYADLDDIEHWVKHLPNLIEIAMFTQESRDRLAGEINKYQLELEKLTKTEPEYDDENDDESKMLVYNQWLEQVQDTYKSLTADVKKLEPVRPTGYPGKYGLNNLLKIAREKTACGKYTQESLKKLNEAIKTAQVVFDNEKADSEQVIDAEWALRDTIDSLEEDPNASKPSNGGGSGGGGSSRRRGSSGGSGGSGGGSSDGGNYVQPQTGTVWDINNSLTKSKYGINVTINADDKLNTAFLSELMAHKQKSVTLKCDWYNWDFYGTSIENTMPEVVWFDTTISTVTPNHAQISKLTGKNDTTVLHFAHQGKLAGKTKITVDIDKYANKKMFVYQYNAAKARLELVQANVNVNASGVMAFTITEGADYIISPTAIKGAVIVPKPVPKPVKKTAAKPAPKK
ncbi:Ig-like protein group 4 [Hydrogenoanaerobacterium saccharovorans]|uniref:Ig-like domain (Group 4) n=1 Tax=Hydrogenoanaerobacterium saccharovorans TaxID=474960 RepID=A0A1H8E6C2_9FIRM|nr:Ig-like domain-containing protein [Hydrogenoanaerobacterium saccharovorans]RPF42130.1 Ig-like protein group 4 [Hydrogenoanaerobacterium saccharovorans]SEN14338.1 Ig-like domain (group 4) [Hydrogenoanaerobacterium saccharovorans]